MLSLPTGGFEIGSAVGVDYFVGKIKEVHETLNGVVDFGKTLGFFSSSGNGFYGNNYPSLNSNYNDLS
jgi:hypothetical protein